jgi:hypothetical protein
VYYGFQVKLLSGKARESVFKVESHLVPEHAYCAGACAVVLFCTLGEDAVEQIEILFHVFVLFYYRLL